VSVELKKCSKCDLPKDRAEFYKDKRASDGLASSCKACHKLALKSWAGRNREKLMSASKRWRNRNPDKVRAGLAAWAEKNRERKSELQSQYAKRHPHKINALIAKRKAAKLQATPLWANDTEIRRQYELAKRLWAETGVEHHVDHIVPLQSALVCGLHVESNLQVLTAFDNLSKNNKHWPDMP
jgi:hypothetical protein